MYGTICITRWLPVRYSLLCRKIVWRRRCLPTCVFFNERVLEKEREREMGANGRWIRDYLWVDSEALGLVEGHNPDYQTPEPALAMFRSRRVCVCVCVCVSDNI